MSNQVDVQIIEEGYRNASVRFTAAIDTSDVTLTPALLLSQLTNNDPNYTRLVGLRVDRLQFTIDSGLVVWMYWNSAASQLIASLSDSNELNFKSVGGLQPNMILSGYDGSINLTTAGYVAGDKVGFSVLAFFVKLYTK